MTFDLWLAFVVVTLALLAVPGQTAIFVFSYGLTGLRALRAPIVAGVMLGHLVMFWITLAGLGPKLIAHPDLYLAFRAVGAVYLGWLGLRALWPDSAPRAVRKHARRGGGVFVSALFVTVLNPKSVTFFIAITPQFLRPEGDMSVQITTLVATFVLLSGLNAVMFFQIGCRAEQRDWPPRVALWASRVQGGAFLALAGTVGLGAL